MLTLTLIKGLTPLSFDLESKVIPESKQDVFAGKPLFSLFWSIEG